MVLGLLIAGASVSVCVGMGWASALQLIALCPRCCRAPAHPSWGRFWPRVGSVAWSPLIHSLITGVLILFDNALGYHGLQLAYGARAVMWGAVGRLRTRHSKQRGDVADCAALPYEIGAFVLQLRCPVEHEAALRLSLIEPL